MFRTRTLAAVSTAVAAAAALLIAPAATAAPTTAAPTTAAPTAATTSADEGWLRLAHLSPDTKSVDVRVSAVSGGSTLLELKSVGYGGVSQYEPLPEGSYTVSMVPAGASASSAPVLSATAEISAGEATTIAAYGPNDDLQVRAFEDDLTAPSEGKARIRLIQASTQSSSVDVATTTGVAIAEGAEAGSVTDYAEIAGGDWTLALTSGRTESTAPVTVDQGSVTTLFVLDTATGGLTILPVVDSAAVADVPVGGVRTGGGWLATQAEAFDALPLGTAARMVAY